MDGVLEGVCCGGAGGGDGCLSDDAVDGDGECGVGSALGVGDGVVEVDGEGKLLAGGVDLSGGRGDAGDLRRDAVDLHAGEVIGQRKREPDGTVVGGVDDGRASREGDGWAGDVDAVGVGLAGQDGVAEGEFLGSGASDE